MKIICHRGLWTSKKSQNSLKACDKGMKHFAGIEIDLKNKNGEIVLSHDPLTKKQDAPLLAEVFKQNPNSFFAMNIKEDGLSAELHKLIKKYKIKNYMCFDLSVPEKQQYLKKNLKVFERMGDIDPAPVSKGGLVLDVFELKNWSKTLAQLKKQYPKNALFIISPELHGQDHLTVWKLLKKNFPSHSGHFLCTDRPEEADLFFNK